jgi:hypothetical protein
MELELENQGLGMALGVVVVPRQQVAGVQPLQRAGLALAGS